MTTINGQSTPPEPEQKPAVTDPPGCEIMISPEGELLVSIPLRQINRTFARGVLEDARDAIDAWYEKRRQSRLALQQGGLSRKAREGLAKIGGLFIPK